MGGGKISEGKIAGLLEAGAQIDVVAPEVTDKIALWARKKKIRLQRRPFRAADLRGMFLVVAATNSKKVHQSIYRQARVHGVLCNIVDVPPLCDFYYPAVVRRGQLQIAISTAGASPSLARRLREELEIAFGPEYADWLQRLSRERKKLLSKKMRSEERLQLLKQQASSKAFSRYVEARRRAAKSIRKAKKNRRSSLRLPKRSRRV